MDIIKFFLMIVIGAFPFNAKGQMTEKPNIIIMLADDLGYGDLSCYNPNSENTDRVKWWKDPNSTLNDRRFFHCNLGNEA